MLVLQTLFFGGWIKAQYGVSRYGAQCALPSFGAFFALSSPLCAHAISAQKEEEESHSQGGRESCDQQQGNAQILNRKTTILSKNIRFHQSKAHETEKLLRLLKQHVIRKKNYGFFQATLVSLVLLK